MLLDTPDKQGVYFVVTEGQFSDWEIVYVSKIDDVLYYKRSHEGYSVKIGDVNDGLRHAKWSYIPYPIENVEEVKKNLIKTKVMKRIHSLREELADLEKLHEDKDKVVT